MCVLSSSWFGPSDKYENFQHHKTSTPILSRPVSSSLISLDAGACQQFLFVYFSLFSFFFFSIILPSQYTNATYRISHHDIKNEVCSFTYRSRPTWSTYFRPRHCLWDLFAGWVWIGTPVFFFLTITILHLLLAPSRLTPQFPQIKRQSGFLPPLKYSCSSISALNSRIATLQQTPPISFELLLTAFLSWLCSPNHSSSMWAEPLFFF